MAERRFKDNPLFFNSNLHDSDIIPFTHDPSGFNDTDGKLHISQFQCIPEGICNSNPEDEVKDVVLNNLKSFEVKIINQDGESELLVGRKIRVTFVNENTHEHPKLRIINEDKSNTDSYDITFNGLDLPENYIQAGYPYEMYFTGTSFDINFAAGNMFKSLGMDKDPEAPSVISLSARRDGIEVQLILSNEVLWNQISKIYITAYKSENGTLVRFRNNGKDYDIVSSSSTSMYYFDRDIDGYPEAEDFSKYVFKFRIINVYGKSTADIFTSAGDISTLGYGSWIPPKVSLDYLNPVPSENSIKFNFNHAYLNIISGLDYYGQPYDITYEYSRTGKEEDYIEVNGDTYTFNRLVDGYPEKEDLSVAKVRIKHKSPLTNKVSYSNECSLNLDDYGTWYPPVLSNWTATAEKDGIRIDNKETLISSNYYGQPYTPIFVTSKDSGETWRTLEFTSFYQFQREMSGDGKNFDGYLEDTELEEKYLVKGFYRSSYKKNNLYFQTKDEDITEQNGGIKKPDLSTYGTWNLPTITSLEAKLGQDGIEFSFKYTIKDSPTYYAAPFFPYVTLIKPTADGGTISKNIKSETYKFIRTKSDLSPNATNIEQVWGVDGYPEAEDLDEWEFSGFYSSYIPNYYGKPFELQHFDTSKYGTWKISKPEVYSRVTDRTVILTFKQPNQSQRQIYGNLSYGVQISRASAIDPDTDFFKPDLKSTPYATEESTNELNYKELKKNADGSIVYEEDGVTPVYNTEDKFWTSEIYTQTLPLQGQKYLQAGLSNTIYNFRVWSKNDRGLCNEYEEVTVTALATQISDLVYANQSIKEMYIQSLYSLSNTLGVIKQGVLASSQQNNFWALSDVTDENGVFWKEGEFRFGNSEQFIEGRYRKNSDGTYYIDPITKREVIDIRIKVGSFETTVQESAFNGEFCIYNSYDSSRRVRIAADGFYCERKEDNGVGDTEYIPAGKMILDSLGNVIITNKKDTPSAGIAIPVGSDIYHLDSKLDLSLAKENELLNFENNFITNDVISIPSPISNTYYYGKVTIKPDPAKDILLLSNSDIYLIDGKLIGYNEDDYVLKFNSKFSKDSSIGLTTEQRKVNIMKYSD